MATSDRNAALPSPPPDNGGDRPPTAERSALMAKVKARDTKPEIAVRKLAHRLGYRFRLHVRSLPGTPDLVFRRLHKVVFVHGCFWHRHEGCLKTTTPKTRAIFWQQKFDRNVERDKVSIEALSLSGWEVLVIWECETRDPLKLENRLSAFLGGALEDEREGV